MSPVSSLSDPWDFAPTLEMERDVKEETSQGKMNAATLTELSLRCQGAIKDSFDSERGAELSRGNQGARMMMKMQGALHRRQQRKPCLWVASL